MARLRNDDDREVVDDRLEEEIELVGRLVASLCALPGPLSDAEIDDLLGVGGHPKRPEM